MSEIKTYTPPEAPEFQSESTENKPTETLSEPEWREAFDMAADDERQNMVLKRMRQVQFPDISSNEFAVILKDYMRWHEESEYIPIENIYEVTLTDGEGKSVVTTVTKPDKLSLTSEGTESKMPREEVEKLFIQTGIDPAVFLEKLERFQSH